MKQDAAKRLGSILTRVLRLAADTKPPKNLDDIIAALMVEAIGADAKKFRQLKRVAKLALNVHAKSARDARRAMYLAEQAKQEFDRLVRTARQNRRARAQSRWGRPPTQPLQEIGGSNVKLTPKFEFGKNAGPSPGGYDPQKDLAARLTGKTAEEIAGQRKAVSELTAPRLDGDLPNAPRPRSPDERGLGTIKVKSANGLERVVSFKSLWDDALAASQKARDTIPQIEAKMALVDDLTRRGEDLTSQSILARNAGRKAEAAALTKQAAELAAKAEVQRSQASAMARSVYNSVRSGFWRRVHGDPDLVRSIENDLGLRVREGIMDGQRVTRGAPFFGTGHGQQAEGLTIEHLNRVSDNPRRAVDPRNFYLSPFTENTQLNEMLRALEELLY